MSSAAEDSSASDSNRDAASASDRASEMDRRARADRRQGDRRKQQVPVPLDRRRGSERRSGRDRRARQGPNTYDLEADELEFVNAVQRFKERSGRPFPTWSEVLGILRDLGYEKRRDG